MKVGDLVKLVQLHIGYDKYVGKIGIIISHSGHRSKIQWSDGTHSFLRRELLEVVNESR
jgi:hypothetical protein